MSQIKITDLFDLSRTIAAEHLRRFTYPWEALEGLGGFIEALGSALDSAEYVQVSNMVWVAKTAVIAPTAYLGRRTIIGPGTEVRHGAFIRENAIVGAGCVVGNSVELKNCVLCDLVEVPHYNYVGDSILGVHAHMGAGSVTSNIKSDQTDVVVHDGDIHYETKLLKVGAMLGDYAEVGCNSVLNPGTVVGRRSTIYPLSSVRGVVPSDHILKSGGVLVRKR